MNVAATKPVRTVKPRIGRCTVTHHPYLKPMFFWLEIHRHNIRRDARFSGRGTISGSCSAFVTTGK